MPTIARKLCSDLVNPILEQSRSYKIYNISKNNCNENPTRSIVIEKRKVINNIIPSNKKKITINKSREILLKKKFFDQSINTIISGPLHSDKNCLTIIHQRQTPRKCSCKSRSIENDTKIVQTSRSKLYSQIDKACYHYSETVTRSTQFFDVSKMEDDSPKQLNADEIQRLKSKKAYRPLFLNNWGAKRWALSQHPTRGPDF